MNCPICNTEIGEGEKVLLEITNSDRAKLLHLSHPNYPKAKEKIYPTLFLYEGYVWCILCDRAVKVEPISCMIKYEPTK